MADLRDVHDYTGMYSKAGRYCVEVYTILQKQIEDRHGKQKENSHKVNTQVNKQLKKKE